jgi:putative transposase
MPSLFNGRLFMPEHGSFRRRNLPHWDVEGKPTFITACLHGSFSSFGLESYKRYRQKLNDKPKPKELSSGEWELRKHRLLFKFVDGLLDEHSPVNHLADARLADIVQAALFHFADVRYFLYAFVVMPSHFHWLFLPRPQWAEELARRECGKNRRRTPREVICHSMQSYTANECQKVLGTRGTFWQDETFDHFARDEAEVLRIIHYIEQNPVVAGIVTKAEDYAWSSASFRARRGISPGEPLIFP